LSDIVSRSKCRTEPSLMAGKSTLCLRTLAISPPRKAVVHLSSILSFRRTIATAWVDRNHRAADAKLDAAQHVIMFRVIRFVRQKPSWPQIDRRLPHGRDEIRRVLAWAKTGNGPDDQLRSSVENSGQLGPRRVLRITRPELALKVDRDMPCFQAGGVDCRRIAGIIDDQAASPSTVTASCEKSLEPPFSRSFCSTCHNVE
jgi:hypothetical protein